ncbi:MAG: NnrS family protein [Alphaproteobacteria bacterium]|nr:NnrS family protein [Alphaproteobacteria bacterium]MCB9984709.1 NnrS family protein [Micavibrio sp.]
MLKLFEHPFWGRGFRPFFFMGALYGVLNIGMWAGFYAGIFSLPEGVLDPISWHAHEMVFGYTMAIVAGFLLTAVANWTGGSPARQIHLAALCGLWLLGRVIVSVDLGLPMWAVSVLASLFVPALAASLAIPLIRSWSKRNFVFLALLSALFACDLWSLNTESRTPLYIALLMILTMVSLIGGRIIPAFTVAALRRSGVIASQTGQMKMDIAALLSLAATAICLVFAQGTLILSMAAFSSFIIHAVRIRHYHSLKAFYDPLLWILHAGYLWLVIGLFLLGLTGLGIFEIPMVIHALTAGCIGSMTLGMICRVTLGHTGRNLMASRMTTLSFVLIQVAAIVRVFGPMLMPDEAILWIVGSAVVWTLCFIIYLVIYTPMLVSARPDGEDA